MEEADRIMVNDASQGGGSGTKAKAEVPGTELVTLARNISQGEGGLTGTTKMSSRLFSGNESGNGLEVTQPRVADL